MAIRNTVATAVTNEPLVGQSQNPRYTHSQLIFTQGGWLTLDRLKRKGQTAKDGSSNATFADGPCVGFSGALR